MATPKQEVTGLLQDCFDLSKTFERPPIQQDKKIKDQIEKKRERLLELGEMVGKFAHNFLYCRDPNELLTVSETDVLNNERSKYLKFMHKNFKYKLPEEFTSKTIRKQKKEELLEKQKNESIKKMMEEQDLKSLKRKRPTKVSEVGPPAKKKVKINEIKKETSNKETKKGTSQKEKQNKMKEENEKEENEIEGNDGLMEENNFESSENLENEELDEINDSN